MTKITIEFYDYIFICDGEIIEKDFFNEKDGDEIARRRAEQLSCERNKPVVAARLLN